MVYFLTEKLDILSLFYHFVRSSLATSSDPELEIGGLSVLQEVEVILVIYLVGYMKQSDIGASFAPRRCLATSSNPEREG
jgi:hypothetical protein